MIPLLSLCMIVKDEEQVIGQCLQSVQGLVDEIIIVDTGSTDRTKDIARTYQAQVYDFLWSSDFAAARNASIDHAHGAYILVLDADEYVNTEQHDQIRAFLSQHAQSRDTIAYNLRIINFLGDRIDSQNITESTGARLFPNRVGLHYTEPIHEQLTKKDGHPPILENTAFTIFHTGYMNSAMESKNKNERNLALLEKQIVRKQDDPYFCFVLGNEYTSADRPEDAIRLYRNSLRGTRHTDGWAPHLYERLVILEMNAGQYKPAEVHIIDGLQAWPSHPDFHCLHGLLLEKFGLQQEAAVAFQHCLELAGSNWTEQNYWLIKPTYGAFIPHRMLAQIYRSSHQASQAVDHMVKAIRLQSDDFSLIFGLVELLVVQEKTESIIHFMDRLLASHANHTRIMLKASLCAGSLPLALHYYEASRALDLSIVQEDQLLFSILSRKVTSSIDSSVSNGCREEITMLYQLIASSQSVTSDASISNLIGTDGYNRLATDSKLYCNILYWLWLYRYDDLYYRILSELSTAETIDQLVETLQYHGHNDHAMELYIMLFEQNALSAQGLEQLGIWQISLGELDNGFSLLEASTQEYASVNLLGTIKAYLPADAFGRLQKRYKQHHTELISALSK